MKKIELSVSTNKIGSACSMVIEFDDDEVPENWEEDREFNMMLLDTLFDSGLVGWEAQEIDDSS